MAASPQAAQCIVTRPPEGWHYNGVGQFCALACYVIFVTLVAGSSRCYAQSPQVASISSSATDSSTPAPTATPQHNSPTANAEVDPQSQQIASQCADLLKLATDLKKQVDNSTKDQLAVKVIREASQIEQLARKVKSENPKD
ncbi:MAG: hypothetical protein WBP85_09780 [Terracidiphilus sp.]